MQRNLLEMDKSRNRNVSITNMKIKQSIKQSKNENCLKKRGKDIPSATALQFSSAESVFLNSLNAISFTSEQKRCTLLKLSST